MFWKASWFADRRLTWLEGVVYQGHGWTALSLSLVLISISTLGSGSPLTCSSVLLPSLEASWPYKAWYIYTLYTKINLSWFKLLVSVSFSPKTRVIKTYITFKVYFGLKFHSHQMKWKLHSSEHALSFKEQKAGLWGQRKWVTTKTSTGRACLAEVCKAEPSLKRLCSHFEISNALSFFQTKNIFILWNFCLAEWECLFGASPILWKGGNLFTSFTSNK